MIVAALGVALPAAAAQDTRTTRDCARLQDSRERRDCERDIERARREREREALQRERERAQREAERERRKARASDFDFDFDFDFDDDETGGSRNLPSRVDTTVAFTGAGLAAELSLGSGEIIVTTWDRPQARIVATSRDGGVRFASTAGVLSVQVRGGGTSPRPSGRIEVTVPAGTRIRATGQSADVQIRGTKGHVRVTSMSGDVAIEDVGDLVQVNSLSGDLTISRVTGDVEVHTVSGDVTISDARGDVTVQSVSGDADLLAVTAKRVRAVTVSGDVTYDGTIDADGRYSFSSTSGDVEVMVPQGTNANVTMRTFSGGINTVFPITLQPGEHRIGATGKRFTFDVGRGGAALSLETFSGNIILGQRGVPMPADDSRD